LTMEDPEDFKVYRRARRRSGRSQGVVADAQRNRRSRSSGGGVTKGQ
jgi:hypothetical protein